MLGDLKEDSHISRSETWSRPQGPKAWESRVLNPIMLISLVISVGNENKQKKLEMQNSEVH
jgi:hypothetical protein